MFLSGYFDRKMQFRCGFFQNMVFNSQNYHFFTSGRPENIDFGDFRKPMAVPTFTPLWRSKISKVPRFGRNRSRMFSYDIKTHFRPIPLQNNWVFVNFYFKKPQKILKNRFFLSVFQLSDGLGLPKPQKSCFSPMIYLPIGFFCYKIVIFMEMYAFWGHFLWTNPYIFLSQFLIGISVFDAVFFQHMV